MTQYRFPSITVGTETSEDFLESMLTQWVIKDNNTDATSDTTLNDDTELLISGLVADGIYDVNFILRYSGDNDGDIKVQWTLPAGATGNRCCLGPGSTASDLSGDDIALRMGVHGVGTSVAYSCTRDSLSLTVWAIERALIRMGSTAGSIAISWAQNASFATATRLSANSWGYARRLA